MGIQQKKLFGMLVIAAFTAVTLTGCGGEDDKDENEGVAIDSNKTNILKVGNALISVPSPIQTAILIKKIGANYNKELLNPPSKKSSYTTNFKKAINLGIYGADLGYVTIYDQAQDAVAYLGAAKKLGEELGVTYAFDARLMMRFESNLGNKDSLINLSSSAFAASDAYFKTNEKPDVSGLIITGGWIETLYFSCNLAKGNVKPEQRKELMNRIGEQRNALNNLIKLLTPYYKQDEFGPLVDGLIDLATDFDGVEIKYTFVKPTTDVKNKITTINSKTEVVISEEQFNSISKKVTELRNKMIS